MISMDTDLSQDDILASCGIMLPRGMPLDALVDKMMSALPHKSYIQASPLYRVSWLAHCLKAWGAPSVNTMSRGYRQYAESDMPQINLMYALKVGEGALICVNGGFGWEDMLRRAQIAAPSGKQTDAPREWRWADDREYQEDAQMSYALGMHHAHDAAAAVADIRASLLTQDTAEVSPNPRSSSPRI